MDDFVAMAAPCQADYNVLRAAIATLAHAPPTMNRERSFSVGHYVIHLRESGSG